MFIPISKIICSYAILHFLRSIFLKANPLVQLGNLYLTNLVVLQQKAFPSLIDSNLTIRIFP